MPSADPAEPVLLEVDGLVSEFHTERGALRAVDDVSFAVRRGGTLGIVGESGCGKSVTSLSIMGLLPDPPGRIAAGAIRFEGRDLPTLPANEMRALRGNRIAMIFQEPMSSLNPVYTVGQQIGEALRLHRGMTAPAARERSVELLRRVGIPSPQTRVDAYPYELSGGMRQRVMIAMAISCEPDLLIADEPTTALDVTIQAQILQLLADLQTDHAMGIVLITHDLGVVAEFVEEVVVMYAGKIVEQASTTALFERPLHPYTRGLLSSVPGTQPARPSGSARDATHRRRLPTIEGVVPDLLDLPPGCRFRQRCPLAEERCSASEPPLEDAGAGQRVACFVTGPGGTHG